MSVNRPLFLALRGFLRWVLKAPFWGLKGFRVVGAERLPRRRTPLILACNHAAFIDSVYLILAAPARFTICGAKPRLFRSAPLRFAMALANILRVDNREQFLADTGELLAAGETLLIYPEMGRFPEALGEFKTWAAEVALAHRVPLLPCYLYGTTRGQRGAPRLVVGEPLEPSGDPVDLTRRLREAIVALAPKPLAATPLAGAA
ncbi:MAG: 1-acyl-sn-glycerol-3-phosphate acyltransferase [Acidobacteriota bacterium]